MNQLLKDVSAALIANDAATLEVLANEASGRSAKLRAINATESVSGLGAATDVLRQQVQAASVQLAVLRRLRAPSSLQAPSWVR